MVEGTQVSPGRSSRKPRSTEYVLKTDTRCLGVTRPAVPRLTVSGVTGVPLSVPRAVVEE